MKRLVVVCLAVLILCCQDSERQRFAPHAQASAGSGYLGMMYYCSVAKEKLYRTGLSKSPTIQINYMTTFECKELGI